MTNISLRQMVSSSGLSDEQTARVLRVLEGYLAELERGGQPQPEALLARHPDLADLLKEYLDRLDLLHEAAVRFRVAEPPSGAAATPATDLGQLGDFQLLREIGRGGMGIVYEAEQLSLQRRVALKVLPMAATMDARQLQRFQNEARAAASLHHTNIVPVYYVGSERGIHYYTMQFIEGRDLASVVAQLREQVGRKVAEPQPVKTVDVAEGQVVTRTPGPGADTRPIAGLSTERPTKSLEYFRSVARLGIQAAEALDHAHQMGILHRDIKPANLLVDAMGRLWVTDFGLAQVQSDTRLTMTGDLVGTLRYMSPEQALAKRVVVDHRTDIYSLGATLYELLTLEPAFTGRDRQELLRQIAFEEPRRLRQGNRAIPRELETIVLKALEKNPVERYATAQELADDLRRFLEDRPIQARRPSMVQRLRKWARRHKPAVATATVLVLAALGLAWWIQQQRAATEREAITFLLNAELLQQQERWSEAAEELGRADGRLAGSGLTDLQARVRELRRVVEFVAQLEDARLQLSAAGKEDFDYPGADQAIAASFASHGLDLEGLDPEVAAARIRASAARRQLVAALDFWAYVKEVLRAGSGEPLLAVARLVDDDSWRNRLRDPQVYQDQAALERLAKEEGVLAQPSANLVLLSHTLTKAKAKEAAVRLMRAVQQRHPADFWSNFQLAALLEDQPAMPGERVGFYRAALALRPHSPGVLNSLGVSLLDQGKLVEAEAAFRQAIELSPNSPKAYQNLGVALMKQGKPAEAEHACRQAITLKPDYAHAHYNLGNALKGQGKLAEAEAVFRQAIALNPDTALAHHTRGMILQEQGKLGEAEAAYGKSIALAPNSAHAHNDLGTALARQGKLVAAETAFRKAIDLRPSFAEAHCNLGSTLQDQGRLAEADAAWCRAIELDPQYFKAYSLRGMLLLTQEKLAEAETVLRKAIALKPGDAKAHLDLGNAMFKQGKLAEAETAFRQATVLKPEYVGAHYNLGNVLSVQEKLPEAVLAFRKTIALKPDFAEAHCNLGQALRWQGQFVAALGEYKQGHELGSRNPRWRYPSARWVREVERLIELDNKLPQILKGQTQPASNTERLELAQFCLKDKKRYAAAARLFADAFAAEAKLGDDPQTGQRYSAACAAALAAAGHGQDAANLDAAERTRLRQQAIDWLNADLAVLAKRAEDPAARAQVRQQMQQWQKDPDFAAVRDTGLAALPEAERAAWQKLWADVSNLLKSTEEPKAAEKTPPKL